METRVSRYAKLREEIEHMTDEEDSTKKKTSQVVDELLKNNDNKETISVKDALKPYEIYGSEEAKPVKKNEELDDHSKRKLLYIIIGSSAISVLLIVLVILGIILFINK